MSCWSVRRRRPRSKSCGTRRELDPGVRQLEITICDLKTGFGRAPQTIDFGLGRWDVSPNGWRVKRLADLGEINRGRSRHRPRYADHLYGGRYPFIQTGDVKASGGRITTFEQTYSDAGLAQSRLWPENTLCITIAANIAETGILTFPACFPDSIVGFIANPTLCDVRFVEYSFRVLRSRIQHEASGSVQDNINLQTLDTLRFSVPSLAEQRAIAGILGSLDDKIELNRQMNETLEAMARALFKSWFVDFDPVRAKAEGRQPWGMDADTAGLFPSEFEQGELGEIPKGWRVAAIGDVLHFHDSKRVPLSAAERRQRPGQYRYYGATSVMSYVDDFLFDGVYLLMGEDGSVESADGTPVLQYVWGQFWVNNHAHVLTAGHGIGVEQLFLILGSADVRPFITGAVQPKLSQSNARRMKIVLATEEANRRFETLVAPMFALRRQNSDTMQTLAELRDTLLPKLLSGEVRVREAERAVEAAL